MPREGASPTPAALARAVEVVLGSWTVVCVWTSFAAWPSGLAERVAAAPVVPATLAMTFTMHWPPLVATTVLAFALLVAARTALAVRRDGWRAAARSAGRDVHAGTRSAALLFATACALAWGGMAYGFDAPAYAIAIVGLLAGGAIVAERRSLHHSLAAAGAATLSTAGLVGVTRDVEISLLAVAAVCAVLLVAFRPRRSWAGRLALTLAVIPVLFFHWGGRGHNNYSFGRTRTPCSEVAKGPGVTELFRVWGTELEGTKVYSAFRLPGSHEMLVVLHHDRPPFLVDTRTASGHALSMPNAETGALENLELDVEHDRIFVNSDCTGLAPDRCSDVYVFDVASRTIAGRLDSPSLDRVIDVERDPATDRLLLSQDGGSTLAALAASGRDETTHASPGHTFWHMEVDADRRRVYLPTPYLGAGLHVLDLDTGTFEDPIALGPVAADAAVDPRTDRIFVSRPLRSRIDVVRRSTHEVEGSMPAPFGVRELDVDPDRGVLVAGGFFEEEVRVYDPASLACLARIPSGGSVRGVRVDAERSAVQFCSPCGVYAVDLDAIRDGAFPCSDGAPG